jgi:hypothetical protein
MKIFGVMGGLIILLIVGAFGYIAVSDVRVEQSTITKDIPTDNLLK